MIFLMSSQVQTAANFGKGQLSWKGKGYSFQLAMKIRVALRVVRLSSDLGRTGPSAGNARKAGTAESIIHSAIESLVI